MSNINSLYAKYKWLVDARIAADATSKGYHGEVETVKPIKDKNA